MTTFQFDLIWIHLIIFKDKYLSKFNKKGLCSFMLWLSFKAITTKAVSRKDATTLRVLRITQSFSFLRFKRIICSKEITKNDDRNCVPCASSKMGSGWSSKFSKRSINRNADWSIRKSKFCWCWLFNWWVFQVVPGIYLGNF